MSRKVVLQIVDWGEKCLTEDILTNTTITLVDTNLNVQEEYMLSGIKSYTIVLNMDIVKQIDAFIDEMLNSDENVHQDACDGEGVKITIYEDKKIVRETDLGYVYGTDILEPFVDYMRALARQESV